MDLASDSVERRKTLRFVMRLPVILRGLGDSWTLGETTDVSATGAFLVCERPFLLNASIEYVLTFPKELTKASQPLRVRYFGEVLRCERFPKIGRVFGIAVSSSTYRYLTRDQAVTFEELERNLSAVNTQSSTRLDSTHSYNKRSERLDRI
jgi:hypothetical protein